MSKIYPPIEDSLIDFFQKNLLEWSARNPRPMPWKGEPDPYKIWLSEVILQQTRVEQGLPYYQRFVLKYPDVRQLAEAPEDELMKLWEGLGYYSRARNLHAAAKYIAYELSGKFPDTYEGIRGLKGVGHYTAAAIASFAFGLPHAVLDGNVYRVLARFFAIDTPTDTAAAQKQFELLARKLLPPTRPAAHNQAMMDFGATCCTPKQPGCILCPLSSGCRAFLEGKVDRLPLRSKSLIKKKRQFYFLVFNHQGAVFVRKRTGKDIWRGLWEFPYVEEPVLASPLAMGEIQVSGPYRQLLTHQEITAVFVEIDLPEHTPAAVFKNPLFEGCTRMARKSLKKNIAFPKVIDWYLQNLVLTLNGTS